VPARMGEVGAEIAEEFEWMAARFGPPPLKRIAISPIPGTFGQGFPGLIYLSTVTYLDDAQRRALLRKDASAETFYNSIIHAHETAHQWWGNLVIPATYHDDWIAEALANYTAMLVLEQKRGTKALEMVLDDYRKNLLAPGKPTTVESYGPITWGYRLRENGQLDPWRAIIYGKGTWIIHMLRCRMGDDAFLRMLATLRKRYEYRTLSTEEFRAHASLFLPLGDPDPSLESFFDTWVYGTGIPTLEMATSVKGKAPAVTLTVTVRQSGAGEDFVAEVPVEIRTAPGAKPIMRWVHTSSEPAVFTLKLKAPPQHVELAPRLAVLARGKGA
jgi:aminopeptidase N